MKRFLLATLFFTAYFAVSDVFAYTPGKQNKRSRSEIDYTVNTTSYVASNTNVFGSTKTVLISSGAVGLFSVVITSPGVNSKVFLYNHGSTVTMTPTGHFAEFMTNTQTQVTFNVDIATGGTNDGFSVRVATAAEGNSTFIAPSLLYIYERKR